MKEKHANIPLFIPHAGCPHRCVFCDQEQISGAVMPSIGELTAQIDRALTTLDGRKSEIAFFGGSFTAIDRRLMISLLEAVRPYLDSGAVSGLRLSTRPDCVDDEVLAILKDAGVTTVELGVQSTDDRVLRLSGRGHGSGEAIDALKRVKSYGFNTVGQMMLGLPGSSRPSDVETARAICACGADGARIYPTVVLKNTALEVMTRRGEYTPLDLTEGVSRGVDCLKVFLEAGVEVLRMGLCDSESVRNAAVAGCAHAAYGEMVRSRLYGERLDRIFRELRPQNKERITVYTAPGETAAAAGYRKENRIRLTDQYGCSLRFAEDRTLRPYSVRTERGNHSALKIT